MGRITNGKSITDSCMGTFSGILMIVSMLVVKLSSILASSVGSTGKIGDSETPIVSVGPFSSTTAVVSTESCVVVSCSSTYRVDGM